MRAVINIFTHLYLDFFQNSLKLNKFRQILLTNNQTSFIKKDNFIQKYLDFIILKIKLFKKIFYKIVNNKNKLINQLKIV